MPKETALSSESSHDEDDDSYQLHPEILKKIKFDQGSLDTFMKMDDLDRLLDSSDKYCGNYILGKIDKTGVVGKNARAEIRKTQLLKERYFNSFN